MNCNVNLDPHDTQMQRISLGVVHVWKRSMTAGSCPVKTTGWFVGSVGVGGSGPCQRTTPSWGRGCSLQPDTPWIISFSILLQTSTNINSHTPPPRLELPISPFYRRWTKILDALVHPDPPQSWKGSSSGHATPFAKCHGDRFHSFCVILLQNRWMNTSENTSSLVDLMRSMRHV